MYNKYKGGFMIEGKYKNQNVTSYVLENQYLKVEVMNLGATLVSFVDKRTNRDLVLGFDNLDGYLNQHGTYFGATVGRCANRIANGEFVLNNLKYHVPVNNGPNSLHGGNNNFSFKVFKAHQKDNEVVLTYHALDGEEGYPGNLDLTITYRLDDHHLLYQIEGISDQDTILNITNHSYFNLSSVQENVLNHELKVYADQVAMVDENGLTKDEVINVKDTAFDFLDFHPVAKAVNSQNANILLARGLDHNYVFESLEPKIMAELKYQDLSLCVESDLPGMHVYTGNYIDGACKGKRGIYYQERDGICFECQYYPNAINYQKYLKPILFANQKMQHFIKYTIK